MATVRKRKWTHNGVEREAWVVTYTDQGGTRRQKTFDKKRTADAYRDEVSGEVRQGVHVAASESVTFNAAVAEFDRELNRRVRIGDLSNGGAKGYRYKLQKWAAPHLGGRKIAEITSAHVQAMVDDLREQYSAASISGIYGAVHVLLTFAVGRGWARRNVLRDQPCKLPKKTKRKAIPTKADIATLIQAAQRLEHGENLLTFINRQVVVACGVFGGFRPGETFGLHWEDIDWEREVIRVQRSHTRENGLRATKTDAGYRRVPMTPPIRRALMQAARYRAIRAWAEGPGHRSYTPAAMFSRVARAWEGEVLVVDPTAFSGYVVLSKTGRPMEATASGTTFWHRLMKNAGLYDLETRRPHFTPHALRHAAASLLIEAGMDDMNLKAWIGHASIQTTKDIYGHLFPTDQRLIATTRAIAEGLDATTARQVAVRHSIN